MSSDFNIQIGLVRLQLLRGDITAVKVDAIVNAANAELAGGLGVDGAIHRVGGPAIMQELDGIRAQIGRCESGSAVVTGSGLLPARFVFHAVGPIYRDGSHGEPEALASCYRTCLDLARQHGVQTISFPSISTGAYGYPMDLAAPLALQTISAYLTAGVGSLHTVKLLQFSDRDHGIYQKYAEKLRGTLAAETHR